MPALITTLKKCNTRDVSEADHTSSLRLLCVGDEAIPFGSRRDSVVGTKIIIDVFAKRGLIPHAGTKAKESKTKAVFFWNSHK